MLSKDDAKLIKSLQQKKFRNKYNLFVVEGEKSVLEFLESSYVLDVIYHTDEFDSTKKNKAFKLITKTALKKISALKNPNRILGVFKIPQQNKKIASNVTVVLDAVQDPGNLGTIIRLCDWFGIKKIVCSINTVDCYNPKVIQATMGSLTRVSIEYCNLDDYFSKNELPVYVSVLNGENIYKTKLAKKAILIMGNEGNGISDNILKLATNKITIPNFGDLKQTESLNVATATAIILSEFMR